MLARSLIVLFALAPVSPAEAGWSHKYVSNDGNVLTYTESGKTVFYIGCGRGFAIHVRYPSRAKPQGDAGLSISTARGRMTFNGGFENPEIFGGTDWQQAYLGYLHSDPRVFGKKWNATKARVLDMLDSKGPITISADGESYQLPAIDVASDWHHALVECRFD
jgi:hypothetical protein